MTQVNEMPHTHIPTLVIRHHDVVGWQVWEFTFDQYDGDIFFEQEFNIFATVFARKHDYPVYALLKQALNVSRFALQLLFSTTKHGPIMVSKERLFNDVVK